jgi:hypothetical protein
MHAVHVVVDAPTVQFQHALAPASEKNPLAHTVVLEVAPSAQKVPAGHGMHVVAPLVLTNVPALHVEQLDALTALYLPATQGIHCVAPGAEKEPAAHAHEAPLKHAEPAEHGAHVEAPTEALCVPFGHATHVGEPETAAKRPMAHAVHAVELAPLVNPGGHSVAFTPPVPEKHHDPAGHARHDDCAVRFWYVPEAQAVHAVPVLAIENEPVGHARHAEWPATGE